MRCIVTVKYDVTDVLPGKWSEMTDPEIEEYFADSPELFHDSQLMFYPIVKKVEIL